MQGTRGTSWGLNRGESLGLIKVTQLTSGAKKRVLLVDDAVVVREGAFAGYRSGPRPQMVMLCMVYSFSILLVSGRHAAGRVASGAGA